MAWFDISGPDFFTLDYAVQSGGETPTVGWDGTEADLTLPGGYNDSNVLTSIVLLPKQFVQDAASNVTQVRITMRATFGASPGSTGLDGFLYSSIGMFGGEKFPDSGGWAQSGLSVVSAVVPDDVVSATDPSDALDSNGFAIQAGDGVSYPMGILETVTHSLDVTVVSVEVDYEILPPSVIGPRFWTNYTIAQEIDL